jgi:hypothetical protein
MIHNHLLLSHETEAVNMLGPIGPLGIGLNNGNMKKAAAGPPEGTTIDILHKPSVDGKF